MQIGEIKWFMGRPPKRPYRTAQRKTRQNPSSETLNERTRRLPLGLAGRSAAQSSAGALRRGGLEVSTKTNTGSRRSDAPAQTAAPTAERPNRCPTGTDARRPQDRVRVARTTAHLQPTRNQCLVVWYTTGILELIYQQRIDRYSDKTDTRMNA